MTCLALIVTCLVLSIALSSTNRSIADNVKVDIRSYMMTMMIAMMLIKMTKVMDFCCSGEKVLMIMTILLLRREGNIQLNLVHPPQRHQPVPHNKVTS